MKNSLNAKPIGQFLISIGTISILGFVFLILFFVGYFNNISSIIFFGPLNNIFGALDTILTALPATLVFHPLLTVHNLHFGFGFIGVWLLILNVQANQNRSWQMHIIGLGFITSVVMILGLAGNSPLGFVILYPVWCIWLGWHILKANVKTDTN